MFRGGPSQVQILSPQFNKKDTFLGVFFVVSEMSHAEAGISGSPYACVRGILQILSPQFKEHHAQAWCFFRFGTATDGFPGLWV